MFTQSGSKRNKAVVPPVAAVLFSPVTASPRRNSHLEGKPLLCTQKSVKDKMKTYLITALYSLFFSFFKKQHLYLNH